MRDSSAISVQKVKLPAGKQTKGGPAKIKSSLVSNSTRNGAQASQNSTNKVDKKNFNPASAKIIPSPEPNSLQITTDKTQTHQVQPAKQATTSAKRSNSRQPTTKITIQRDSIKLVPSAI